MAKNNNNNSTNNTSTKTVPNTKTVNEEKTKQAKQSKIKKAAKTMWTATKVVISTAVLGTATAVGALVIYGVADELDKCAAFEKNERTYYSEKIGFRTRYFNGNGRDVTSDVKAALKSGQLKKEDIGRKEA